MKFIPTEVPFEVVCKDASDFGGVLVVDGHYMVTRVHGGRHDRIVMLELRTMDGKGLGNYMADRFEYVQNKFDILVEEVMRAVNALRIYKDGHLKSVSDILREGLKKVGVDTHVDAFVEPIDAIDPEKTYDNLVIMLALDKPITYIHTDDRVLYFENAGQHWRVLDRVTWQILYDGNVFDDALEILKTGKEQVNEKTDLDAGV